MNEKHETTPKNRRRRFLFRGAALTLSGLAAFLAAEAILRLAGISYPSFARPDPVLGTFHIPNARGRYIAEGDAWVSINSQGLRDEEHSFEKPPGTFRIAVLGDSYAEALQVDADEAFWAVLERELKDCDALGGRKVECINFGVSGYGTAQELLMLKHKVVDYDPDLVLLAFLPGNDLSDNMRELKKVDYIPYYVWEGDKLVLDDSFLESEGFRKLNGLKSSFLRYVVLRSRVMQVVNQVRIEIRRRQREAERNESGQEELGINHFVFASPKTDLLERAWRTTDELIRMMHRESDKQDARFAVAVLTASAQVSPDDQLRENFRRRLGASDLFYPERRIEALGEAEGFPVLALARTFQAEASASGAYFHGFGDNLGGGHWNEDGHRRAGELMGDWLCRLLAKWEAPSTAPPRAAFPFSAE